MDAAKPSPAPISARRWLRAMYTPRPSSTRVRIGSTNLRSFSSRYPGWALTRYLAENRASVGLMLGSLVTIVNPRLARSRLTTSINGPRFSTTWLLLIVTAPLPCPDRAFTSCACTPVDLHPQLGELRAGDDLGDLGVDEAVHGAGELTREAVQQRADPGQALRVSAVAAWVVSPFTLSRVAISR